jgi:hypothetical protein
MESTPAAYAETFGRAYDEAAALAESLTPAQFNWKPAPDVWSVAECLVHLNTTNAPYLAVMEKAVEKASAQGGPRGAPPFRYGWAARWFIAATGPQPSRKMKSPAGMRPAPSSSYAPDRVLADYKALTDGFLALLKRAERERLDLSKIRVTSPFFSLLRLPVGADVEALAGHGLRHLAQARRVTEHSGFPK